MYSDHFEGVHPHTYITYVVLFPATPGPGDIWPVHWKTYEEHPASSLEPVEKEDQTYVFATPAQRRAWWKVVRRDIIWVRMPTTNSQLAYRDRPDYYWLDLTDGLPTPGDRHEESAA